MRTLAPLYTYAGDTAIYAARVVELQPGDVAVVTSGDSGPLPVDQRLMQHIADLGARGVQVLGYVHLDEPSRQQRRPVDAVLGDIATWALRYGVNRVFFDEWPASWGSRWLGAMWGACRGYTGSRGVVCAANPGVPLHLTVPPPAGALVVTHEGPTVPSWRPEPWEVAIVHSVTDVAQTRAQLAVAGWQWGYVTADGPDGNPFDG